MARTNKYFTRTFKKLKFNVEFVDKNTHEFKTGSFTVRDKKELKEEISRVQDEKGWVLIKCEESGSISETYRMLITDFLKYAEKIEKESEDVENA